MIFENAVREILRAHRAQDFACGPQTVTPSRAKPARAGTPTDARKTAQLLVLALKKGPFARKKHR